MNGHGRWIVISAVVAAMTLAVGLWTGWNSAVRTDAAFHERIEMFMEANKDDLATLHALTTTEAVHSEQIGELGRSTARTDATVKTLSETVNYYLNGQMKDGRIPR